MCYSFPLSNRLVGLRNRFATAHHRLLGNSQIDQWYILAAFGRLNRSRWNSWIDTIYQVSQYIYGHGVESHHQSKPRFVRLRLCFSWRMWEILIGTFTYLHQHDQRSRCGSGRHMGASSSPHTSWVGFWRGCMSCLKSSWCEQMSSFLVSFCDQILESLVKRRRLLFISLDNHRILPVSLPAITEADNLCISSSAQAYRLYISSTSLCFISLLVHFF